MSSKKARRRQRKEQSQERPRRRLSPVAIFMLSIGAAVVLTVVGAVVFRDGSAQGDPPWPGAVWSAAHDHWH